MMNERWRSPLFRRLLLGVCLTILGGSTIASTWFSPALDWRIDYLARAIGAVLAAYALFIFRAIWTGVDGSTDATLRLDWYLPALRKTPSGQSHATSAAGDWIRQRLPSSLVSNRQTKKRGWVRRILRRLGISWLSVPIRRMVQTCCWLLFVVSFFYVCWPYDARPDIVKSDIVKSDEAMLDESQWLEKRWPTHYADNFSSREMIPADLFLTIDPLVAFSTALASRQWVWSLSAAGIILIVCLLIPRGFCGYLCPLGTTIDLFDWAIAQRFRFFRVSGNGWWVHLKYYLLVAVLVSAACGVLISGYFSAIPVLTRGLLFAGEPLQSGTIRGWHLVPKFSLGQWLSLGMFVAVLCLGFLQPRFWCKYVCPSGAVFSLGNLFRLSERKVESSCIHCNKCVEVCPFDAIKPDFTTRTSDCTLCQTCAGVCPTHAIKFVDRSNLVQLKKNNEPPTGETSLGRRGFLSAAIGGTAAVASGLTASSLVRMSNTAMAGSLPIRPPGSVPEKEFLEMCIRCGECFKVCPNNVLQPEGFQQGWEGLWTPLVNANWAGCESSCNACGQVCPTGAIRALPIEEKRAARMGLAEVNLKTCLPYADSGDCDLCVVECKAAGYDAIEYMQVGTEMDADGKPVEGTGRLAPVVLADKCVGCGLCQTRCVAINVKEQRLLKESAIVVRTGEGKEDRLLNGSYVQLRQVKGVKSKVDFFVPKTETESSIEEENPFF